MQKEKFLTLSREKKEKIATAMARHILKDQKNEGRVPEIIKDKDYVGWVKAWVLGHPELLDENTLSSACVEELNKSLYVLYVMSLSELAFRLLRSNHFYIPEVDCPDKFNIEFALIDELPTK